MTLDTAPQSIARIYGSDRKAKGMGFLITERHVLTCAHVVEAAIGHNKEQGPLITQPSDRITLDFPCVSPQDDGCLELSAEVIHWLPVDSKKIKADIAVLRLSQAMPQGVKPVRFVVTVEPSSPWHVYGCPEGGDRSTGGEGLAPQYGRWQLDVDAGCAAIQEGFSGTAVWEGRRDAATCPAVLGMVVARVSGFKGALPAFMLPAKLLREVAISVAEVDLLQGYLGPCFENLREKIDACDSRCLTGEGDSMWPTALPETLPQMLMVLSQCVEGDDSQDYLPLHQFVAELLQEPKLLQDVKDLLEDWLSRCLESSDSLTGLLRYVRARRKMVSVAQGSADATASLLFKLNFSQSDDLSQYRVSAWVIPNPAGYDADSSDGVAALTIASDAEKTFTLDEMPRLVDACLAEVAKLYGILDPTVEIFLPLPQLNEVVENWEIKEEDDFGGSSDRIGHRHHVLLRSTERTARNYRENPRRIGLWKQKWVCARPQIASPSGRAAAQLFHGSLQRECGQSEPLPVETLKQYLLTSSDAFGVRFSHRPCLERRQEMATVLSEGIPLVVWLREAVPGGPQSFNTFLLEFCLGELLEQARCERVRSVNPTADWGCHLTILWDNPNLLPPKDYDVS